jgi:hypothetical protein
MSDMGNEDIVFGVKEDRFHVGPTKELYRKLTEAQKETGSKIRIKTSYGCKTRPSEYVINGSSGGCVDLLEQLANTKQGDSIQISFEPPVSDDYLDEFKERIKHLFD